MSATAVIAGAGPAGLTAALELLRTSQVRPLVFEQDAQVGGISRTINYRGNRMDLGGHRFFSKSDWVMNWWQTMLPVADDFAAGAVQLAYQGAQRQFAAPSNGAIAGDQVMLVRRRLSRIFYRRRFFDYPLKLNWTTLSNLGLPYSAAIAASYAAARLHPRRPELTLEDFLINRFGDALYRTFFKDYTEKVWGVPCAKISAEWGAQRIKGLSIGRALAHALRRPFLRAHDTAQKGTETSLVERFLYPRLGPGQMWERVAAEVIALGGEIHLGHRVIGVQREGGRILAVDVCQSGSAEVRRIACDQLISTMPVKELVRLLQPEDPQILQIASQLPYRDFMTAGLLVRRMLGGRRDCPSSHYGGDPGGRPGGHPSSHRDSPAPPGMPPDNWIYVQEPDVKLGRLQIFNNWSPALVADPATIWLGLEYFCTEGDDLWNMRDAAFLEFAGGELARIGLIAPEDILDGTVVRVPKAYPAYFGAYGGIHHVRSWLDSFVNLYAVGRNGMHRYNNQDHSMLAAKAAVECITRGSSDKSSLWSVNAEDEYHETVQPQRA